MPSRKEVGPFEVLERLGAGGMGEVFKARDRRLNRFVALKFLPEAATDDARERFQREALAIAALNHPNICALHEIGDDEGHPYLVLELLEGETLRARLARGPLGSNQLLDWATQIADALDAAHKRLVLHRDLKPDNIWVSSGGHIKVLDFGLARLDLAPTGSDDRTLTSPGATLGTVPYMSPEQARGEVLDARSDLFSFGSVLYEMATGRAAFPARSAAETIAAILKEQPPPLRDQRPDLPPRLEEVVNRCLEKDPDLRYQSAADLRSELKRLSRSSQRPEPVGAVASTPESVATPPPRPGSAPAPAAHLSDSQVISGLLRRHWRWPVAVAALVLAGGLAYWRFAARSASPMPHLQFRQLTFTGQVEDAVVSPDGKFLAHVDLEPKGTSLHLLSISSGSDVEIVPPGNGCCQSPSFSPDVGEVYFIENRVLRAVPVLGGNARTIASPACSGAGFSPDGSQIAFVASAGPNLRLMLAHADGSQLRQLATSAPGAGFTSQCWGSLGTITHAPSWSPDARWIAVPSFRIDLTGHIKLVSARDGHTLDLGPNIGSQATDATWLPNGKGLVFTASMPATAAPQLWEVGYPDGRATPLTSDLQGYASTSISALGELALVHNDPQSSIWTQAGAGGSFTELPGGGASQDGTAGLAWTPQGGIASIRNLGGQSQIWVENSDGSGARAVLSPAPAGAVSLAVAPNGQMVFVAGSPATLWHANADGSGLAPLLLYSADGGPDFTAMVRGGREVAYLLMGKDNQTLCTIPLAGGNPRQVSTMYIYADGIPASPDGQRLLAVQQVGTDTHQPVIIRLDGGSPMITPVGLDFKTMAPPYAWTPDGRAITYVVNQGTTDNLWAFPLPDHGAGSKPYPLTHFTDLRITAYAFSHDGRLAISRGSQNSDAVLATGLAAAHR